MKMRPNQRQLYLRGQMDGERGLPPKGSKHHGDDRVLYERGYGRGYDARYRAEHDRKRSTIIAMNAAEVIDETD